VLDTLWSNCMLDKEVNLSAWHWLLLRALEGGSRDSSVGVAILYGLGGPWIDSRCGGYFPYPSRRALGLTQPSINKYRLFTGVKEAGALR
jgi:hypothetical protein